jgi:DNA replication protein DnaC
MIPPLLGPDAPPGERLIFQRLAEDPDCADWLVLHSLHLADVRRALEGEIDFVVIIPGLGVLCLEVKSHHKADRDVNGIWYLGKDAPTTRSPLEQAAKGMHAVLDYLKRTRLQLENVPVWSAVWFTNAVADLPATPEWHSWQLLDRHDLREPVSRSLSAVMVKARSHFSEKFPKFDASSRQPDASLCETLAAKLRPKFELAMTPREISKERAAQRLNFIEEQYEALDLMEHEPRALFTGPAGTGKSFLAAEAARRHAARGDRVLLLCFNRLLGATVTRDFAETSGVQAGTLHSFMLSAASAQVPQDANDDWWSQNLPEQALERLLEEGVSYDVLILDEAQDVLAKANYLDVLDASVVGGLSGGRWLMFGDFERQMLYGQEDGRSLLEGRVPHYSRPRLMHNCRNTPQIGAAASRLAQLPDTAYRGYRRRDDGVTPVYRAYERPEQQQALLDAALDALKADHYGSNEVVVISPRGDQSIASRCAASGSSARLAPYNSRNGRVGYTTVQAFKGLEAPAVIVTDIEAVDSEADRSLLYVALSRASDRLYVFAHKRAMAGLAKGLTGRRDA